MTKYLKTKTPYIITSIILGIAVLVAIFLIFNSLGGKVKTFGAIKDNEYSESITCFVKNYSYPFFAYYNTDNRKTTLTMTFNDEVLTNIYLVQELYYINNDSPAISATMNHVSMNEAFGAEHGADAFNANYYYNDNLMRMTLYAKSDQLTESARKFFLISNGSLTKNTLINEYRAQGFICNNY